MRLKFLFIIPLILALLLLPTAVAAEPWPYDQNEDGVISKAEATYAVNLYFDGLIPKYEAVEVVILYFLGNQ